MARYVEFTPEVFAIQDGGGVHVWWFPSSFSQSQLGDRVIGSNACTLICTLMAGRLHEFEMLIWGYFDQPLSRMLITSMAEAIVEGNEIHEAMMSQGQLVDIDLTVPEALTAIAFKYQCLTEWLEKTIIVVEPIGETLAKNMKTVIQEFDYNPPPFKKENSDLYMVLVCGGRSVLFCYQSRTSKITLMDSHAHIKCEAGAVVAQARISDVNQLCSWYVAMCAQAYDNWTGRAPYELAILYVRD